MSPNGRANVRADLDEIRCALALLVEPGSVVELRVPKAGHAGVVSGYSDALGPLVDAAARWSGRAEGVYVTLNPCTPAVLSRAHNRVVEHAKTTTSDAEVLRRCWLLVDLDPRRPAGISSTDAEHAAALARAQEMRAWLAERGWPVPILADSGNGAHLLYRVELPNDADARALIRRVLDALALVHDDDVVAIDPGVYNAARISKVYGTLAAKGDSTPDRPHRLARILDAPAAPAVVPPERLVALADLVPVPPPPGASNGRAVDVDAALAAAGHEVTRRKPWNGGAVYELRACPFNAEHSRTAWVVVWPDGRRAAGCFHASCQGRSWPEWRAALGLDSLGNGPTLRATTPGNGAIWTRARTAGELLATGTPDVEWLDFPLVARGVLTEINAPRGTGKSIVVLARMVALARKGSRVLYLDRDNSPSSLRKRLKGLGADDVPTLRVLTRDQAPPLSDVSAWAAFPRDDFDVFVVDAWDSFAEGAGEQDSRRSTLAMAPLLDVVRRDHAPGVIMLCNVTKDGAAGRGSGTLEDRSDVVYEARDATGFSPTGHKPWWEELPPAARADWASRATRRTGHARADRIRVAFVNTKFRDENDPDPFAVEVDFTSKPWATRDVTAELVAAGDAARGAEQEQAAAVRQRAADALVAEITRRTTTVGGPPLLSKPAEALLVAQGLKRQAARELLKSGTGERWSLVPKNGRSVAVVPLVSLVPAARSDGPGNPHEQRRSGPLDSADRINTDRPNLMPLGAAKNAAILTHPIGPPDSVKLSDADPGLVRDAEWLE